MRITIKDIANACGVSSATVSLALSGKESRISEDTCRRIREVARKMNYHPNIMASRGEPDGGDRHQRPEKHPRCITVHVHQFSSSELGIFPALPCSQRRRAGIIWYAGPQNRFRKPLCTYLGNAIWAVKNRRKLHSPPGHRLSWHPGVLNRY